MSMLSKIMNVINVMKIKELYGNKDNIVREIRCNYRVFCMLARELQI